MPELPEVHVVADFLEHHVQGKTIDQFQLFYTPLFVNLKDQADKQAIVDTWKQNLHDQTIQQVFNYGKYLIFKLDDYDMISHLRMEGKWILEPPTDYAYDSELVEAQFSFTNDKQVLRYYDLRRFGTLQLVPGNTWKELPAIAKLGYQPDDVRATPEWLYAKLQHSRKAIKTVLLDQTIILGLGNIYANEVLFAAKINPLRPANEVSLEDCKHILDASKRILADSIVHGGTTIHSFAAANGVFGHYQQFLKVHGRAGQKCEVCGHTIEKIMVNGRGTYFCPYCQKD